MRVIFRNLVVSLRVELYFNGLKLALELELIRPFVAFFMCFYGAESFECVFDWVQRVWMSFEFFACHVCNFWVCPIGSHIRSLVSCIFKNHAHVFFCRRVVTLLFRSNKTVIQSTTRVFPFLTDPTKWALSAAQTEVCPAHLQMKRPNEDQVALDIQTPMCTNRRPLNQL